MHCEFRTISQTPAVPDTVFAYIIDLANWSSFAGWGPLPGIVEASLPAGETMRLGARVQVRNTDGSTHHEVVTAFDPGRAYAVRMEPTPPATWLMDRIEEEVELAPVPSGTRVTRTFRVWPRSALTYPLVWVIAHVMLRRAIHRHDRETGERLAGWSRSGTAGPTPRE